MSESFNYIIKYSNKKTLYLSSEEKLTPVDVKFIKDRTSTIKNLFCQKKTAQTTYENLRERVSSIDVSTTPTTQVEIENCQIKALALPKLPSLRERSFLELWKKNVTKWPIYIPIVNLFWAFVICPIMVMDKLTHEPEKAKLRRWQDLIHESVPKTQGDYIEFLEGVHEKIKGHQIDDESDHFSQHLEETINYGRILQTATEDESVIETIMEKVKVKLANPSHNGLVCSIPVMVNHKGNRSSLMFSFSKTQEGKLRLDINAMGDLSLEKLSPSYEFSEEHSLDAIEETLSLIATLLLPQEQGQTFSPSFFESIKLKTIKKFDVATEAGPAKLNAKPYTPDEWLHTHLYLLGGKPLNESLNLSHHASISGFVEEGLTKFFPEAPLLDKIDLLFERMCLEMESYLDAMPHMKAEQKLEAIEVLQGHISKFESSFLKGLTPEEIKEIQESRTFKKFFNRLNKVKDQIKDSQSIEIKERVDAIASHAGKREFAAQINPETIKSSKEKKVHAEKSENVFQKYSEDLEAIQTFVTTSRLFDLIQQLKKVDKTIDGLIAKRKYLEAKELALEVMERLPVPEEGQTRFWSGFYTSPENVADYSGLCASLSKHVWESSLRLYSKAAEPNTLLQMMKMQVSIMKMLRAKGERFFGYTIDKEEFHHLFFLHPHYRMGTTPESEKELLALYQYLNSNEGEGKIARMDGEYRHYQQYIYSKDDFAEIQRSKASQLTFEEIDLRRAQMMMTTLVKPDYYLCKHLTPGAMGQAAGLNWLNSLRTQAVNEGAETTAEIFEKIQELRLRQIQEVLVGMGRLELDTDEFVTEKGAMIKIIDKDGWSGSIAYLPEGLGLPSQLEKMWDLQPSERCTRDLAGEMRGEAGYLGAEDGNRLNQTGSYLGGQGCSTTLSPQRQFTEPSLLYLNLQTKPKGIVGQVTNYHLEAVEFGKEVESKEPEYYENRFGDFIIRKVENKPSVISADSILEGLSFLLQNPYLLKETGTRAKLEAIFYRPFAMQIALRANPEFFLNFSEKLHELLQKRWGDTEIASFLIKLESVLHRHVQQAIELTREPANDPYRDFLEKYQGGQFSRDDINQRLVDLKEEFFSLESQYTRGSVTKPMIDWVWEQMVSDTGVKGGYAAILIDHYMHNGLESLPKNQLPDFLFVAQQYLNTASLTTLPQLTSQGNKWIFETLIPYANKEISFRSNGEVGTFLDQWVRTVSGNPSYTGNWTKESEGGYRSDEFLVDLNQLSIKSLKKEVQLEGMLEGIADEVRRDPHFLKLFGKEKIQAQVERGSSVNEVKYDFTYKNQKYCIEFDRSQMEIKFYFIDPTDDNKRYVWVTPKTLEKCHGIDKQLIEKGIWVNEKNSREGRFFLHYPKDHQENALFHVKLNGDGLVKQVLTQDGQYELLQDPKGKLQSLVPSQNSLGVLFYSKVGADNVERVQFLSDGSQFVKNPEGDWELQHHGLGKALTWTPNVEKNSSMGRFLETLGPISRKVGIPLQGDHEQKFILYPHQIQRNLKKSGELTIAKDAQTFEGKFPVPVMLSFKEGEKVKGSPSAFLYLAYLYANARDYKRAHYYLSRAAESPRVSEKELRNFETMIGLLQGFSAKSLRGSAFALKAYLTIHQIRAEHFGKTNYHEKVSDVYFHEVQRLVDVFKVYVKRFDDEKIKHWSEEEKLTAEERKEIERLERTSLRQFTDALKKISEEKKADYELQPAEAVKSLEIDKSLLANIPHDLFHNLVVCADNLSSGIPLKTLLGSERPNSETLLRNFFPLLEKIAYGSDQERKALKHYLVRPAQWLMTPPQSEQEEKASFYGEVLRLYLIAALEKPDQLGGILESVVKNTNRKSVGHLFLGVIQQLKDLLPFHRFDGGPLATIQTLYDLARPLLDDPLNAASLFIYQLQEAFYRFLTETLNLDVHPPLPPTTAGDGITAEIVQNVFQKIKSTLSIVEISEYQRTPKQPFSQEKKKEEETIKGAYFTTIHTIKEVVEKDERGEFLPLEKQIIPEIIDRAISEENINPDEKRDLHQIVKDSESRKYSVLEMRVEAENLKEIGVLEQKNYLNGGQSPFVDVSYEGLGLSNLKFDIDSFNRLSEKEQQQQQVNVENAKKKLAVAKSYFSKQGSSEIENEENKQFIQGLDRAFEDIAAEIKEKSDFSKQEIRELKSFLKKHTSNETGSLESLTQSARGDLIKQIKEQQTPPISLRRMLQSLDLYSDEDLIEEAMKLYEGMEGQSWLQKNPELVKAITKYLLLKTACQQLVNAQKLIDQSTLNGQVKLAVDAVKQGLNFQRYFNESGELIHQNVTMKCLVAEAREGIIFRKKQFQVILGVDENPNQWLSLRMGIGKTSYIMPIVAKLLAEKGLFPILTVPERLFAQNRNSFDRATRELFDQAGMELDLPLKKDLSPAFLSEVYLQLLKIRNQRGYVVTKPQVLANINEVIIQLTDELRKYSKDNFNELEILTLQKRMHYLKKIAHLIHGDGALKSHFFGDEVDDTHCITNQINLATGDKVAPNSTIRQVTRVFFEALFSDSNDQDILVLQEAMLSGSQAAIPEEKRHQSLVALAKVMRTHPAFAKLLQDKNAFLTQVNEAEWVQYLLGKRQQLPQGFPAFAEEPDFCTTIGFLKEIFRTSDNFFTTQVGNNLGFSDFDDAVVVPKVLKNETKGMRFGDEFELIFAQYLAFQQFKKGQSLTGKSQVFFTQLLPILKEKDPLSYQELSHAAQAFYKKNPGEKAGKLIEFLMEEDSWKYAFSLLEQVFEGGYVDRFGEQIEMNAQDLYHGCSFGGVTGTLDPYVLPFISDELLFAEKIPSTREVEAETLLRMGLNHEAGLDTPVKVFTDKGIEEHLRQMIEDNHTRAIINNSGVTSEGKDHLQWVKYLRGLSEEKPRPYLFIHPTERVPYFWLSDAEKPHPYRKQKLPENTICLFLPSDTRGTDLPIGRGDVHLVLGATATVQEAMQATYRARQLGGKHKLQIHIAKTLADNVEHKGDVITFGDHINYIKNRTLESKGPLNEKAQIQRVKGDIKYVLMKHLRNPTKMYDRPEFWDKDNMEKLLMTAQIEKIVFEKIRDRFIRIKNINPESAYAPTQIGKGVEKVLQMYELCHKEVENLQKELSSNTILKEISEMLGYGAYSPFVGQFVRSKFPGVMDNLDALDADLKGLLVSLDEKQAQFISNIEKHQRYLPEETVLNGVSDSGTQEQVLELQQETVEEIEEELEPEDLKNVEAGIARSYQRPVGLFESFSKLPAPFEDLLISPEAVDVFSKLPVFTGDAIFYFAVSNQDGRVGVIAKQDYHQRFRKELRSFSIFAQVEQGNLLIGGEGSRDPETLLKIAQAKLMLGCSKFNEEETRLLKEWIKFLPKHRYDQLEAWARDKGTNRLLKFIDQLKVQ